MRIFTVFDAWLKHAKAYTDMIVSRPACTAAAGRRAGSNDGHLLQNFVAIFLPRSRRHRRGRHRERGADHHAPLRRTREALAPKACAPT
jgi:hypothetical protein